LRPDLPGSLIKSADLDSRIKTLFDALTIPTDVAKRLGGDSLPLLSTIPNGAKSFVLIGGSSPNLAL
jgi:hypothetical protein